jgi:WhiB family redox-sensing transcriptional regulator
VRHLRHDDELTTFIRWLMDALPGEEVPDPSALLKRPLWHEDALCRGMGPAAFVTSRTTPDEPTTALCKKCPVRQDCLDFALTKPDLVGVWGGTTQAERRWLIRADGR